jgi:hypothetical protein
MLAEIEALGRRADAGSVKAAGRFAELHVVDLGAVDLGRDPVADDGQPGDTAFLVIDDAAVVGALACEFDEFAGYCCPWQFSDRRHSDSAAANDGRIVPIAKSEVRPSKPI